MRIFGHIFKVLMVLIVLSVLLGTAGYMRIQQWKEPGRVAPYAEAPKVDLFSQAPELIKKEIEAAGLTPEYVGYNDSNIGIYIVLDWKELQAVPGLYEDCGEPCANGNHLTLQRYVKTSNALKVRKDVFINMNDFADYDQTAQKISYSDDDLACLRETLRREIEYLRPPGETVLKCQKERAEKRVTNGSIASGSSWQDLIGW